MYVTDLVSGTLAVTAREFGLEAWRERSSGCLTSLLPRMTGSEPAAPAKAGGFSGAGGCKDAEPIDSSAQVGAESTMSTDGSGSVVCDAIGGFGVAITVFTSFTNEDDLPSYLATRKTRDSGARCTTVISRRSRENMK